MHHKAHLGLLIVSLSGLCGCQPAIVKPMMTVQAKPSYRVYPSFDATIHTLWIPLVSGAVVLPVTGSRVMDVDKFAQQQQAIAVLNGGFFDPINQRSTSYVTIAGKVVEDPHTNLRLMTNADLKSFLPQILNRSEFRQYQCGGQQRFDIALKKDPVPQNCQLWNALGAGPQLLPTQTAEKEGFWLERHGQVLRDPLGLQQRNARSAIGITKKGELVWAMVAQKSAAGGLTLPELAQFLRSLGVEKALNLDGGTSSTFYYQGKTIYGKVDANGQPTGRPVKSVLILKENSIP
jgi:Phosphodiester glycosidase